MCYDLTLDLLIDEETIAKPKSALNLLIMDPRGLEYATNLGNHMLRFFFL